MNRLIRMHDYGVLNVFHFTSQEAKALQWMDDGKEFLYKGEMYDVTEIVDKGDSCKVTAIADKKEKQLFDQLAQSEQHAPVSKESLRFIFSLISNSIPVFCTYNLVRNAEQNRLSLFPEPCYVNPVAEISTPPPKYFSNI